MAKRIQVLVDRDCDQPHLLYARTSLWKKFLGTLGCSSDLDIQEISISDMKRKTLEPQSPLPALPTRCGLQVRPGEVRIDDAQVLVINWDAANGDFVCGSDDVFLYFQTQRDKRDALLRGPGTLICEFQCGSGMLFQGAYDAIFGPGEVRVVEARLPLEAWPEDPKEQDRRLKLEEPWTNTCVVVSRHFRKHPLLAPLSSNKIESRYRDNAQLFNFTTKAQQHFFSYRHRDTIYRGWFEHWGKEWVPLLIAQPRKDWSRWRRLTSPPPAVLLAKSHEGGLMLASTMWLAVPGAEELVAQILTVNHKEVAEAHERYFCRRWLLDAVVWLPVTFIVACCLMNFVAQPLGHMIHVYLDEHWRRFMEPVHRLLFRYDDWPLAADVGAVWLSLIAFHFWKSTFRNRPLGVSWFQFLNSGRKTFLDSF